MPRRCLVCRGKGGGSAQQAKVQREEPIGNGELLSAPSTVARCTLLAAPHMTTHHLTLQAGKRPPPVRFCPLRSNAALTGPAR